MTTREALLAAYRAAVIACDPRARVRDALVEEPLAIRRRFGVAIGKAAVAMANGAGPVERGVCVAPATGSVPDGWEMIVSAHPVPDERSIAAAIAARAVVDSATVDDVVIALISGGTSSLIEQPIVGVTLDDLRAKTSALMASGAPIAELNAARSALSAVKRGGLVAACAAPVVSLLSSDVVGDSPLVIGSAPTIRDDPRDRTRVIAPMTSFALAMQSALSLPFVHEALVDDVATCAARLVAPSLSWGEPTLVVPADHGEGGRAQQLALLLAKALRGTQRIAMVIGSDGIDGPPPRHRPAPAGAIVDGSTWDAIVAIGLDPDLALARCDAGTVLAAVDALVISGPTGINHGDVVAIAEVL